MQAYYLVEPKPELLEATNQFKATELTDLAIWNLWQHPHTLKEDYLPFYGTNIKIVFLARLSNKAKHRSDLKEIIEVVFGDPPVYSIQNFDKWWTLRHIPRFIHIGQEQLTITTEDIRSLQKSGDHTDERLEGFIRIYEKFETADEQTKQKIIQLLRTEHQIL